MRGRHPVHARSRIPLVEAQEAGADTPRNHPLEHFGWGIHDAVAPSVIGVARDRMHVGFEHRGGVPFIGYPIVDDLDAIRL